jgi:signal transduction histidine kinase
VTSLRSRILLGALLWTLGAAVITHLAAMTLQIRFPQRNLVLHGSGMSVTALLLLLAGLWLVRRGMSPISRLRERLAAVREGRERRLEGSYPTEVQPLVNDLNLLLDDREKSIARAQAKAGDLAHGLKTPLAILSQEAERAEAAGHSEMAATLRQQVERMRRQVDYHLAHARAAASGPALGVHSSVSACVEALARTLLRIHTERGIAIDVRVAADHAARCQREDLDEMLGNLLDNACKWARSRVTVESSVSNGTLAITVDDDGPGLDPSMRDAVLQRGVRADEVAPGSGFGLAIVRDLAELYAGSVALEDSPSGGVRARLRLPAGP